MSTIAALAGLILVLESFQLGLGAGGHAAQARAPEFLAWSTFASIGVIGYAFVFLRTVRLVRPLSRASLVMSLVAYLAVCGVVLFALSGHGPPGGLETVRRVMPPLYAVAEVAAAPSVLTVWFVHTRLRQLDTALLRGKPGDVLVQVVSLKTELGRCLTALSFIASTGLVNTALLRKAYLTEGMKPEVFPATTVLLYGAGVTAIVTLIYVPAHLRWRDHAVALVEAVYPVPADARPTEDWADGRARLRELAGVDAPLTKTLAAAFGILAPLVTSLFGVLLPGLKAG
ncbi:hypothetical protein [Amycolatopsis camponoti]|uniref:hypothetical protein n=1 Tax=Amycolatopsis camponoti TaxID=2606593 RepID=UPI0018C21EB8|nr:hypothetical protein [Amycolatopsis camponoti]